jgi:predicted GNAT family acetyltransferase
MLIQHKHSDSKGVFYVAGETEDDYLAELIYMVTGDGNIIVEHTEVSEELQGQNVGYQLVNTVVEYARSKGIKITPMCSFTRAVMEKKPEFRDVASLD